MVTLRSVSLLSPSLSFRLKGDSPPTTAIEETRVSDHFEWGPEMARHASRLCVEMRTHETRAGAMEPATKPAELQQNLGTLTPCLLVSGVWPFRYIGATHRCSGLSSNTLNFCRCGSSGSRHPHTGCIARCVSTSSRSLPMHRADRPQEGLKVSSSPLKFQIFW